jgi:hypothetical protein
MKRKFSSIHFALTALIALKPKIDLVSAVSAVNAIYILKK